MPFGLGWSAVALNVCLNSLNIFWFYGIVSKVIRSAKRKGA